MRKVSVTRLFETVEVLRSSVHGVRLSDSGGQLGRIPPIDHSRPRRRSVEPLDSCLQKRGVNEDGPSEREALLHLMPRAARRPCLDEDHRSRQAGHQAIALREVPRCHRRAGLKGRNHEMFIRDSRLKTRVMTRVRFVERRADDGNRAPPFEHGGFVSRGVDPSCKARENHETPAHELAGNARGEGPALVRRAARAHHRDARAFEETRIARCVQRAPSSERDGGASGAQLDRTARRAG